MGWHKRAKKEPGLAQIVVVKLTTETREEHDRYMTICFGVCEIDEEWEWWYDLPAIPEER